MAWSAGSFTLLLATGLAAAGIAGCGGSPVGRTHPGVAISTSTTATINTAGATGSVTTSQGTGSGTTGSATALLPGVGRPPVVLGDTNTPEQFVLGALYDAALSGQGFTVERTRNIGDVTVRAQAMLQGTLDLYPEYLDLWDTEVAGVTREFRTLTRAWDNGERYAAAHGLQLLAPTPFSDTSGLAVMRSFGNEHGLRSLGDLRRLHGAFTVGAPPDFISAPQGLPALERAYVFLPASTVPLTIGAQYVALRAGKVTVAYVSTTDGMLSQSPYRLLRDPRHVMGFGNVVPVVSDKAEAREGPDFAGIIERVDALLTPGVIRGLNAEVELGHHDPDIVAREFLQGNGIPISSRAPATTTTTTVTATTPTRRSSRSRRRHARRHRVR